LTDIIHRIGIKAPASKVLAAVSSVAGIAGWWTRETSGDAEPGGSVEVVFHGKGGDEMGRMRFELAQEASHQVVWRFVSGPPEWLGTSITFTLTQKGDQTLVLFGHRNWREASDFTAHCSMKWATFLLSLRQLVESGLGMPAPDDMKIDDWN
jgi:uncharacterized protein YndB with AHSA1/START domain